MVKTKGHSNGTGGKGIAIGVIISVMIALFLMMICSLIMTVKDFSEIIITILSYAIISLSSFSGGWMGSKILGKAGMRNGCIIGGCFFIVIAVCGIVLNGFQGSMLLIVKCVCCIFCGTLGGILGVNFSGRSKIKL